ncbi:MAG: tRNA (adenosine(37)-N6)-threonylcarbamoyltransferase complex transferase subunit TsaD [Candidatus Pacebacteria bacterium]|nr:tRNA (adenosine(37)-N6)-threonylcarbamoyltransferase complex transferase subunit TsaD [Candidatus Paceibacterota bacterium]MDD2757272.1 tRNA (adenosine(37)-N6)-threonylcarbamoyltransferase complex transferase subunit TsaD [Candidatus Paceibacterota bacterium]MDD3283866.1 tRNA (adenosine(37)-N6)-threonylcarbamoyltransferase complex transferase subunit TsaD [Candidatus Paceibacterota bacterium]MDD3969905.1 tRNA (adenosine(37)-N6)-threonylcarbamoyltransferase complex transferase subunit TsaD [Ca
MIVLSIETSCDDTAISIIKAKNSKKLDYANFEVLSNLTASQIEAHKPYGGVFPAVAKREHQSALVPLLIRALKKAGLLKESKTVDNKKILKIKKSLEKNEELFLQLKEFLTKYQLRDINKTAVTIGPGLEPCLYTGINLAKSLSYYYNIPAVGINHLEGHILSSFLSPNEKLELPAIALIVSGGNTQLIYFEKIGKYKIIGETRDDAAGECFDKTARILGLDYPGGPEISKKAKDCKTNKHNITLPRPMINDKNYDFSFSGLKTAVLYHSKKNRITDDYVKEMSFEIESSIVDVLISKTLRAVDEYKVKSLLLGGGVTANQKLIKEFKKRAKVKLFIPHKKHTGDNALMIGLVSIYSPNVKKIIKPISNLKIND